MLKRLIAIVFIFSFSYILAENSSWNCRQYHDYNKKFIKTIDKNKEFLDYINNPDVIVMAESHLESNAHKKQRELIEEFKSLNEKYSCLFLEGPEDFNINELERFLKDPNYSAKQLALEMCKNLDNSLPGNVIKNCKQYANFLINQYFFNSLQQAKKLGLKVFFVDSNFYPMIHDLVFGPEVPITVDLLKYYSKRDEKMSENISTKIKTKTCKGGILRVGWGHATLKSEKHKLKTVTHLINEKGVSAKNLTITGPSERALPLAYLSLICDINLKENSYHVLLNPSPRALDLPADQNFPGWDAQVRKIDLDLSEPRLQMFETFYALPYEERPIDNQIFNKGIHMRKLILAPPYRLYRETNYKINNGFQSSRF